MIKKRVLFVCLGNICRSPAAQAVFQTILEKEELDSVIETDSAGTIAYHKGEPADPRMKKHALKRGYRINHKARKFDPEKDFINADYIVTMDSENYADITAMDKEKRFREKVFRMSQFSDEIKFDDVPDPYYLGPSGFENVLDILEDSCPLLLNKIKNDIESENKKRG